MLIANVPMTDRAREALVLQGRGRDGSGYLYPSPVSDSHIRKMRKLCSRVLKRAGMARFARYELGRVRHTAEWRGVADQFVMRMLREGASP